MMVATRLPEPSLRATFSDCKNGCAAAGARQYTLFGRQIFHRVESFFIGHHA